MTFDSTSDNTLMVKVKNGDLEKLGLLFERYHRRLFGFFYRLTSRRDLSSDLVQDVFERILKYRNSYTGEGEFSSWIFCIARNLYSDQYHRMKQNGEYENPEESGFSRDKEEIHRDEYDESGDRMLLEQALDRLDSEKKQALILSRIEGFRYREIAEITGCSESLVKVRIFRGLKELKEIVAKLGKEEKRDRSGKTTKTDPDTKSNMF